MANDDDYIGIFIFFIIFLFILIGIILLLWYYYGSYNSEPYSFTKLSGVVIKASSSSINVTVPPQPDGTIIVANVSIDSCTLPLKDSTDPNTKVSTSNTIILTPIGSNNINYVSVATYTDNYIIALDSQKVWIPGSTSIPSTSFTIANVSNNDFITGNPITTSVTLSNNSILNISCTTNSLNSNTIQTPTIIQTPTMMTNTNLMQNLMQNNLMQGSYNPYVFNNTSNVQRKYYNSDKNCTNKGQTTDTVGQIPITSLDRTNTMTTNIMGSLGTQNTLTSNITAPSATTCTPVCLNGAVWSYLPSSTGGNLCIQGYQSCTGPITVGNQSGVFTNQCLTISGDNLIMGPLNNATSWNYSNNYWCDSSNTKCIIYDNNTLSIGTPTSSSDRWINYPQS